MPRKTIVTDLDRFRPPSFDLERYDRETETWGFRDWAFAFSRRASVRQEIERFQQEGAELESRFYGSRKTTENNFRKALPHLFYPGASLTDGDQRVSSNFSVPLVTHLTIDNAIFLTRTLESDVLYQRTVDSLYPRTLEDEEDPGEWGIPIDLLSEPVYLLLNRHRVRRVESDKVVTYNAWGIPVQVNLHAPDVELRRAFDDWLKQARTIYRTEEPRPKLLNRASADPVISRARLREWRDKRILAFLDLFLWNRFYNPPPVGGLWKRQKNGFWHYRGVTWTVPRGLWLELIGLPRQGVSDGEDVSEDVFKNSIRRQAMNLISPPYELLDLLEAQALSEDGERHQKQGFVEKRIEYFIDFDPDRVMMRIPSGSKK